MNWRRSLRWGREPEPEPADVDDLPMVRRSAAQAAVWIARVLALPEDGEVATALRVEFEADELDGQELEAISTKQLRAVLRRAGVPKEREAEIRAREAIAAAESPAVQVAAADGGGASGQENQPRRRGSGTLSCCSALCQVGGR
eukprot:COSAG06_NODE_1362_length_9703_cov_30.651708_5_plen_144_part_00